LFRLLFAAKGNPQERRQSMAALYWSGIHKVPEAAPPPPSQNPSGQSASGEPDTREEPKASVETADRPGKQAAASAADGG